MGLQHTCDLNAALKFFFPVLSEDLRQSQQDSSDQISGETMTLNRFSVRDSRRYGAWKRLAASVVAILLCSGSLASAQSVVFEGQTFVNKGLVGVARVPSNAVDQFGETLGGFGSGMAMDLDSWHKTATAASVAPCSCCPIAAGTPKVP